jgi:predicted permease
MSLYGSLTAGLRSLFRGRVADQEVDDELNHFIERATAENVRNGMTREAAARAARMLVGGTATREHVRSAGWESRVEFLLQDLRYAVRGLRRNPGFTAVVVLTLALGVGANTSMFSVVNAVMLRPLPWRDANELALITTNDDKRGLPFEGTAYATVSDWRTANRTFSDIGHFFTQRVALTAIDANVGRGRTRLAFVSANTFSVLGVAPAQGRVLSSDDEAKSAPVAVISHTLWQRWFNGDPGILGRTLALDGPAGSGLGALTIVGVMPAGFYFPTQLAEIWTPSTMYVRFTRESAERFPSSARRWTGIGRVAQGASMDEARADLARVGRQLAAVHVSGDPDFPGFATTVLPMLDSIAGPNVQSALLVLLGAVSLVLLVACVNVANLLLARGASRRQEFAVRRALGASRARIARQLIAESVLLALIGGAIGVLLAAWGTRALGVAAAAFVPRITEITTDWRVLSFALAASVVAGLAFGLVPAMRLSAAEAVEALKEGGRGTGQRQASRNRSVLVMAECALAIVLLTGAGLLLRSLDRLQSVNPGFDPVNVLAVRIEFPSTQPVASGQGDQARASAQEGVARELIQRISALPGVTVAGFSDDLFIGGLGNESIRIPGRAADEMGAGELAEGSVTAGFFPALRVPLRQGRYLTNADAAQKIRALSAVLPNELSLGEKERLATAEPVVVNEAFVRRFFANEEPVGKRFYIDPDKRTYWYEIVGVVGDMHRQGLDRKVIPQYFGPYLPSANGRADLLVRTSGDPLALAAPIRRVVTEVAPGSTIVGVSTADAQLGGFSALRRLQTWLLTTFAGLALALAAVGVFGLVHYGVAERTREIGVRMALGASRRSVIGLVLAQGMRMPVFGTVIGLLASAALTRVMSSLLFGIGTTDPVTYFAVAVVLVIVAAAACYIAARHAVRIDPLIALRRG